MRVRDRLAKHNERIKLRANFLNALSIGFFGFAFLRPLVEGILVVNIITVTFWATGLVLFGLANYILRYLEKEETSDG